MNNESLTSHVDAIVMLTWSNWFTELRSNRYHYATRFAKLVPVIFVQPDLADDNYKFEETEVHNVVVLHIPATYDSSQTHILNKALIDAKVYRPIFWVYNGNFENIISSRYSVMNIFHATEDYLSSDSRIKIQSPKLLESFNNILEKCDILVAVSEGVKDSFELRSKFEGRAIVATNGCDYKFYSPIENGRERTSNNNRMVLYQGNIFDKLDYDLLYELAERMSDWQFNFCGKVVFNDPGWAKLCLLPNVAYLGLLSSEELREECYKSTVGIIPFVPSEYLIKRSFPLKTFEYLAAGLPVVTISITSLLPYSDVLLFADTTDEFEMAIKKAEKLRFDEKHLLRRLEKASMQDYDLKFAEVLSVIEHEISLKKSDSSILNIIVLYEPASVHVSTIREHLNSFNLFSKHKVSYLPATQHLVCEANLDIYDVLLVHYSIRVSVTDGGWTLSSSYTNAIQKFGGYKVLFMQDEYDCTETARQWISGLGIHTVYTCVPTKYIEEVYPKHRFPHVDFVNTLTGYIPVAQYSKPKYGKTTERSVLIGYRGRELPYWYGSLGQEKLQIGIEVKKFCLEQGLNVDIEWEESKRIYGAGWYDFLGSCRATLGTESGANIFDYDGVVRKTIEQKTSENPSLLYADIHDECIAPYETIKMNQISPKLFEAISLKTALILFEGEYSDVLTANLHYIPLKKDYTNIKEVIALVQDDKYIKKITEQAYTDIIESGKFTYQKFINEFDSYIVSKARKLNQSMQVIYSYVGYSSNGCFNSNQNFDNLITNPSNATFDLTEVKLFQKEYELKLKQQVTNLSSAIFNLTEFKLFQKKYELNLKQQALLLKQQALLVENYDLLCKRNESLPGILVKLIKLARVVLPRPLVKVARRFCPEFLKKQIRPTLTRVKLS